MVGRGGLDLGGDPPPEVIGPYTVVRRLGGGGMGDVFMCLKQDGPMRLPVAVKLIRKGMDSPAIIQRFRLEQQLLGSLSHPNIARLLDAGVSEDGRPYLVMEFVEGQHLDDYCNTKRLSIHERLELFRKICDAVHTAHSNLIVHRDLKPSNILVDKKGEPRLVDFGIARILNPAFAGAGVFTAETQRLMTPQYASPEQVSGQSVGTASDIYSLGVILYELLTGRRPYALRSVAEAELRRVICEIDPPLPSSVVTVEPDGPSKGTSVSDDTTRFGPSRSTVDVLATNRDTKPAALRRSLQGDIDCMVMHAMKKIDRRRYSSAAEFAQDIDNYFDGRPLIARRDAWWYVAVKFARRHRLATTSAAAIAATLVISSVLLLGLWRRAEAAETSVREQQSKTLTVFEGFTRAMETVRHDREGELTGASLAAGMEPLLVAAKTLPDDPILLAQAAAALEASAGALTVWTVPGPMQVAQADAALSRAVELRRQALKLGGGTPLARAELAQSLQRTADNLFRQRGESDVLRRAELQAESSSIVDTLLSEPGLDVAAKRSLASALFSLCRDGGEKVTALRGDRLIELCRSLVSLEPRSSERRHELARALMLRARPLATAADPQSVQRSLAMHEEALALQAEIARAEPDRYEPQVQLMLVHAALGRLHAGALNQPEEALRSFQKARLIAEGLPQRFPGGRTPELIRQLAVGTLVEVWFNNQSDPAPVMAARRIAGGAFSAGQNGQRMLEGLVMSADAMSFASAVPAERRLNAAVVVALCDLVGSEEQLAAIDPELPRALLRAKLTLGFVGP